MKPSIPLLLTGGLGALLLWCGITDRNPVAVLRAILAGGQIPAKGSGSGPLKPVPLIDPNAPPAPNATMPPPGTAPSTPPYLWESA